ncbi:MAG: transcription-repair coupling factor [Herpetosiphonaceae bacterium]|nr:transcription-repair coupling factor [Herpetosiphonaceae bacterium]
MELAELLPLVADHPQLTALRQRLAANHPGQLQVGPLLASARPLVVAQLVDGEQPPLVVVTATLDQAAQMCDDLCSWLGDEQLVSLFPSTDALAYEHMSIGEDVIGSRLQIVQALHTSQAPLRVIVAPVKALMQPTMSPADLDWAMRRLAIGQQVDPRALTSHWQRIGYQNRAIVEVVGEWSLRGGIIDIWPPTHALPLRIEFFGDEIESLRRFDPLSQRSEKRERSVEIGPPHDIPFWQHELAAHNLAALNLDSLRPEVRTEWQTNVEHLEQGQQFEGRAFFTPLFFPDGVLCSLLDHLPPGTHIMLNEAREIGQTAHELQGRAEATRATQIAEGELPPTYPRPYLLWADIIGRSHSMVIDLSNQPVADMSSDGPQARIDTDTLFQPANRWGGQLERALDDVARRLAAGEQVVVVSPQSSRIAELWADRPAEQALPPQAGAFNIIHGSLSGGWSSEALRLTLLTDSELFGFVARRPVVMRRKRQQREIDRQAFLQQLVPGDHVVHIEHGIAIYEGLRNIKVDDKEREYLHLRYAAGDALYVPVDQIDRVSKYIGGSESTPALNRLGSADWERVKRKVKAAVEELARELLDLYAARQVAERPPYAPDTQWQRELEDSFPYAETDDQLEAIEAIKHDLQLPRPMDRLICGDVGYGKTEVAIRAAFKIVQEGKQVAVLVPTTVLAQQHYDTFRKRMAAFPVEIEMLSRFRSPKEQKAIIERLQKGQIDIVIGTHRLLSKDIQFKELGLVVVDEEQRFGVKHKERLKTLRTAVDVLTLTATPIPRTLHMAMAGMRDMSVIDTPPEDRVPIKTYVVPYEDHLVRDAILREIGRGGQIFFVHNRVHSIYSLLARLRGLLPDVRFLVGHGQMEEKELERVMVQFFAGEADVLLSTTIIESGLDVPRANTIMIDEAPNYGLAQLYQLRGRVGRSTQRAYAYLLYHPGKRITGDAQQRLEAIQEATELGAGFRIAMRDLEIRGAGNLLGPEQSGNIAAVGFDLYTQLLAQAVEQSKRTPNTAASAKGERREVRERSVTAREDLRRAGAVASVPAQPVRTVGGNGDSPVTPIPLVSLDLPLTAFLPTDYITDDALRLRVYQKLAQATTPPELRQLRAELKDRFGAPPPPAEQLIIWLELKALALRAGVASVATNEEEIAVRLPENRVLDRVGLGKLAPAELLRIGPQFARINRRAVGEGWIALLQQLLLALGTMNA